MCVQIAMVDDLPDDGLVLAERLPSGYVVYVDESLFTLSGSLTESGVQIVAMALASLRDQMQALAGDQVDWQPLKSVAG